MQRQALCIIQYIYSKSLACDYISRYPNPHLTDTNRKKPDCDYLPKISS